MGGSPVVNKIGLYCIHVGASGSGLYSHWNKHLKHPSLQLKLKSDRDWQVSGGNKGLVGEWGYSPSHPLIIRFNKQSSLC